MIQLRKPIAISLVAAWLATAAVAFWLGKTRVEESGTGGTVSASENSRLPGASGSGSFVAADGSGHAADGNKVSGFSTADRNPVRALLGFAEMGADDDMPQSLRELAEAMDLGQVTETIAALEQLEPSPSQSRALRAVLSRWAQLEPQNAYSYVAAIDRPKQRFDAKLWVLKSWGEADPAGALAHIKENPDSSISRHAEKAIFDGLANGDINVAMGFLESLNEDDSPYGGSSYGAIRELFDRNDREVISWASSLPMGEMRDRAIHAVVDQWARYDPEAAKVWMEQNAGGRNLPEAQVELGESWARVDPEAALGWAKSLDTADTKTSERIKQRIFSRWMEYDYEAAANYLVEQEPSPEMDVAFEMYVHKARYYDPEATMAWAESITDEKRRKRAIYSVAAIWKGRDKAAYESYMRGAGLMKPLKKPAKKL